MPTRSTSGIAEHPDVVAQLAELALADAREREREEDERDRLLADEVGEPNRLAELVHEGEVGAGVPGSRIIWGLLPSVFG